jgi:hypothetical protein
MTIDQDAVTISPDAAAFHAKKFAASVTVAPDECIAAVVPLATSC